MNKNAIKIIKRDKIDEVEKINTVYNAVKADRKAQINLVNAVNDWVSERRTNSRREKVFSNNKISEWKVLPETSTEPMG